MIRRKKPVSKSSGAGKTSKKSAPKKEGGRGGGTTRKRAVKKKAPKRQAAKKSAPKKATARSASRKSSSPFRQWLRAKLRWLVTRSLVIFVPLLLGYTAWLDWTVRAQFEGKRWELPARVYAAPVELYVGKPMGIGQLEGAVRQLGYRRQSGVGDSGSYQRVNRQQLRLHTRPFRFWDGAEAAVQVAVAFDGNRITRIDSLQVGQEVDIIRLDPLPIGSFFPAHGEDRQLVRLEELPDHLVQTLITVEDRAFFDHFGINPLAIARAVIANIRAGRMVQGGSTLTQQLAKNLFLTRERTLWRKVREALITLILELHYEKEEILEAYLNEVYFGQDQRRSIHGVGMASHFFFGHDASQLTLEESALLVGMLKGPSRYNPRRHPERAEQRRDLILNLLAEQGVVSEEDAAAAIRKPLRTLSHVPTGQSLYPAFLDLVRSQILRDYKREDLTTSGLQIFTTLNPLSQQAAEWGLQKRLKELGGKKGLQGAVVVVHPESGEVEAVVGGSNPRASGFNRALHAVRPIGSLVKPPLYLAALEQPQRYTLVSPLQDQPFQIRSGDKVWQPDNYDKEAHGEVLLYQALSHSYNLSTARLGVALGIGKVARTLERLGVEREIARYPSLFLGSLELSPLEVAQLYQPLAANGLYTPLRAIRGVVDHDGNPLNRYPLHVSEVAAPEAVSLLQWGMQEVVRNGTAQGMNKLLSPALEVAGKTGTTDELRDSWFAGFSGDRLAVVWMGRDDNRSAGLTGSTGALHVWGRMMSKLPNTPLRIRYPEAVEEVWVDESGNRLQESCNYGRWVPFIKDSEPLTEVQCR